jgi:hypothetical protein
MPDSEALRNARNPISARLPSGSAPAFYPHVCLKTPDSNLTFRTSGDVFRLNFRFAVTESGERAVGRLGNGQQAEDLALQIGELGVEQLHGMAGLRQPVALGEAEQA